MINFIWMKLESNFCLSNQIRRHIETENLARLFWNARGLLLIPLCTSFIHRFLLSAFLAFPIRVIGQGSTGAYGCHPWLLLSGLSISPRWKMIASFTYFGVPILVLGAPTFVSLQWRTTHPLLPFLLLLPLLPPIAIQISNYSHFSMSDLLGADD